MGHAFEVERLVEPAHARSRLLLVDDEVDDLLYYSAILQNLRYDVRSCASFTEAANLFAREKFDLVIVSQGGSCFEGRTVLARAIEADRTTPVLVLTRKARMDCYFEAMQMGAFDYVQKPLTPSELADLVRWHLRTPGPARGAGRAFTTIELLLAVVVLLIVAAIGIPQIRATIHSYRAGADARAIAFQLTLARMRAAADFTRAEVVFNAAQGYFDLQVLNTSTSAYQLEGGVDYLSPGSSFSFGSITAPAGDQTSIQQTSPIIFNSRGQPMDSSGAVTGNSAVYLTNNGQYYAITVSVTGNIRVWQYGKSAWTLR